MASEVEDLIEEQKEGNLQLELLNRSQETFESILLELEIQTEENDKFFKNITDSIKVIGNIFASIPSAIKESLDITAEERDPTIIDAGVNRQRDILADFVQATSARQSEISDLVKQNKEISALNSIANEKFESSISFGLAGLAEKLPIIGTKISSSLKDGIKPIEIPELNIPEPLSPEEFMGTLEDSNDQALFRLISIDRGISAINQRAIDNDTVKGSSTDIEKGGLVKDDKGDDGFGLSSLFGSGKGGKGSGVLGKLGKAVKLGGVVVAAGFFLHDLFEGFTDDETILEITGKAKEDLTNAELSASAIANGISGLTFGLLDATTVFETVTPMVELFQKGVDQLFDPEIGYFGTIVGGILNAVDKFSSGDILGGFSDLFDGFIDFPERVFSVIGRWLDGLFDFLPNVIQDSLKKKLNVLKNVGSGAVDFISSLNPFSSDDEEEKVVLNKDSTVSLASDQLNKANDFVVPKPTEVSAPKQTGLSAAIKQPAIGNNIPVAISPVAVGTSAAKTTNESKKRFEERNTKTEQAQPAPIIIQQPAQQERRIERQATNPDLRLSLLNNGMLDG